MNIRSVWAISLSALIVFSSAGTAVAQDNGTEEECASCRTTNFYYVLVAAIIVFAAFFWWTNKNRVPKAPVEPDGKKDEKV
jgi:hypothetical protein